MKARLLMVFSLIAVTALPVLAQSVQLADGEDHLSVQAPAANSVVQGNVTSTWKAFDDDQSTIPFELTLRAGATCTQQVGLIAAGNMISSITQPHSIGWNSAAYANGNYCVEVCVSLINGGSQNYTACSSRRVTIKNAVPTPPAPPAPKPTPTPKPAPSPSTSSSSSSTSSSTSSAEPKDVQINISEPKLEDELSGKSNKIAWSVASEIAIGIKEFNIYYFPAAQPTEKRLIAKVAATVRSYIWDVSGVQDGNYQIALELVDDQSFSYTQTSQTFSIANQQVPPSDENITTRPLIINVLPAPESNITERTPVIYGEFSAPVGANIDPSTFSLRIDDFDRTSWCETITAQEFSCAVDRELELGVHKVQVGIKDTEKRVAAKEWSFTIGEAPVASGDDSEAGAGAISIFGRTLTTGSIILACIICMVALVLLLVPWWLYLIWRRRHEDTPEPYIQTTTENVQTESVQVAENLNSETAYGEEIDYASIFAELDKQQEPETVVPVETVVQKETVVVQPEAAPKVDPTQFETYEEYLAAAGGPTPQAPVLAVPEPEPAPVVVKQDPNYITVPDYNSTFISHTEEDKNEEKQDDSQDDDTPEWLRSAK